MANKTIQQNDVHLAAVPSNLIASYLEADRHDAATMAKAQRSGAAYLSANRNGYTVLIRARQNDQG